MRRSPKQNLKYAATLSNQCVQGVTVFTHPISYDQVIEFQEQNKKIVHFTLRACALVLLHTGTSGYSISHISSVTASAADAYSPNIEAKFSNS
jgi:hypothetical protein